MKSENTQLVSEEVVINDLRSSDYEELYPLISPPHLGYVDEKFLKKVFKPEGPDVVTGLALRAGGKLVGCMGFIPQERVTREGNTVQTVNLTCAVSHPDYRGYGLKLFRQLNKFDDVLFTALSASDVADVIYRKVCKAREQSGGFQIVDGVLDDVSQVEAHVDEFDLSHLSDYEKSLYFSHEDLECNQFLIKSEEEVCFLITRKVKLEDKLCSEIVYFGHEDLFVSHIPAISKLIKEHDKSEHCVISLADTPVCLINLESQIKMKEPRVTFGIDVDIPFISLHSENLIFGL
ncbi:GNAT family protein [Vibrio nigripulchritudo]|uniref:hypothetical protein n=1 Tax=Vibrio nigripulchritudo TaxID=28173 RepID=UPI0005FA77AC|nr:hypothetical protein [Vibrio nigripulchritudo]KJY73561.1 hypothetical protein TW74_19565 [Vibrio nigripulchritudo]BDU39271.1 hypothetical protein TUMSATVNIG2_37400 [Vibrio nigripulchritudo]BDU44991.1 hypothetical protein TUMSATVNIG3_37890 [Vibrio nigripulchritudo]